MTMLAEAAPSAAANEATDAATPVPQTTLPALREELTLHPGPNAADGAPTWSLQDPVRNQFFMIDWPTFEVLARWHLADAEAIVSAIAVDTTLELELQDIEDVQRFLMENQLLRLHNAAGTAWLASREKASRSSAWQWLLHHYLFFRVPLVRPDKWLQRTLPLVEPLFSKGFMRLTLVALLIGLTQVFRQWEHFAATLVDTLTWQGAFGYALALVLVKTLHELGHAYTAKQMGCRVPTMGLAFLVMWPVAYTDVNEVWKLTSRKERLAVGSAGILTELAIAAWATLAWALLPDGVVRDMAFVLATTTWISTVVVNASPFMRFDGYFLMSDALGIPNLHARSFALARWDLRERLFGFGEPVPEHFSPARQRGLIVFAYAVWIYRLMLFLGIAALVYHYFFKALGIFLFMVEIGWFVALPVWREMKAWRERWQGPRDGKRTRRTLWLAVALLLAGLVPWNFEVSGKGVMRTVRHFPIHAPGPAQLAALPAANGAPVPENGPLLALASPDLDAREHQAVLRLERLRWQLSVSGLDENLRSRQTVLQEEVASAEAELVAVRREKERYMPAAPFAGIMTDVSPDLRAGDWVAKNELIGTLIDPSQWRVETYLTEADVERIAVGDVAHFFPETPGFGRVDLRVTGIDRDATRILPEAMLALDHGGDIMVRSRNNQLVPEKAIYRVTLVAERGEHPATLQVVRGRVVVFGKPKSLLGDFARSAAALLVRESGW